MTDHERIWLEPAPGADEDYGRQWCQHEVWEDGVEYVRADLAEITTLRKELAEARAENERLLEVLEPFAARAGKLDGIWKDHETQWSPEYGDTAITVGHLRAASAAFRPPSKAKGEKK